MAPRRAITHLRPTRPSLMRTSRSPFDSPVNRADQTSPGTPDPWLGRLLGQYRIVSRLGQGGMGDVYRAVDRRRNSVALKLLAGPLPEMGRSRRLLREANSAQRLRHPIVVAILDAGECEGTPFLV